MAAGREDSGLSVVAERYGADGDDADAEHVAGYHDAYLGADLPARPHTGGMHEVADDVEPISGAVVAQHRTLPHGELRADFGAHLETHYPRLVAQLYAITLHPGDAHEAVQDAYSRAWRRWSELAGTDDAVDWVRRVAIRTSTHGWRQGLARIGLRRSVRPSADAVEPRTAALLDALARLPIADRRSIVLHHMAGVPVAEIAELDRTSEKNVRDRLRRGRHVVTEGLADVLGDVVGPPPGVGADEEWVPDQWDGRHGMRDFRGEAG